MKAGRLLNPRVYSVEHFGHKHHYDQNKKLGIYRAVHVCARDGYSGMIVEFSAMPVIQKKQKAITQKNTNINTKNS